MYYNIFLTGSLTDKDCNVWNINKLGSILDHVNESYGIAIEGNSFKFLNIIIT